MESLWALRRERVDPTQFARGHVGPYLLGRIVRATLMGEVVAALHHSYDEVIELERYAALRDTSLAGPDCPLLADLSLVTVLRHRYVAPVVGAGMEGGTPYVVRPHRLGRTLAEVLARCSLDPDLSGAIMHAIADAIGWLADQGPSPGSCSVGGFDESDVFLCFDGEVQLLGIGTKLARAAGRDPIDADFASLRELAERLDVSAIVNAESAVQAATLLRHAHRSACAERASRIGSVLRARFEEAMHRERELYGLPLLH